MRVTRMSPKVLLAALAVLSLLVAPSSAQTNSSGSTLSASPTLSQAPPNSSFVTYINTSHRGSVPAVVTLSGQPLGLVPQPLDFSHLITQAPAGNVPAVSIPTSYDLRSLGRVTAVRNQGSCGSCWAFATYGSMESILTPAETRDFSENNLKNLHGYDFSPCAGGNASMSMAYLTRWDGPINESDDSYKPTDINSSPTGLPTQKHVQSVVMIPGRGSALNNNALKSAVMTYGGIQVFMFWNDAAYNYATSSYYDRVDTSTNHSVTLEGWDDNYAASNFSTVPPGNGAFLVKNSWGTYWGQSGYFWASYYDAAFAVYEPSYAYNGNDLVSNYSRQYEYDPLGWVTSYGYGSSTAWFANVFSAVATEQLQAVSFYVASNNSPYVVSVYTGVSATPTSGILAATTSGTLDSAGYQTVTLPSPVQLTNGVPFSVVVQLTTPGYSFPIPAEVRYSGYTSSASSSPGQSFFSSDGAAWLDATKVDPSANVCLKAFTTASPQAPAITSLSPSSATAGGAAFTLVINGTGFIPGAVAKWNGTALTTTLVNATQVKAAIPAALIASPGTASVTVTTSLGTSAGAAFTINPPPLPTITGLSPSFTTAGGAAFTLLINGTNFIFGAAAKWNGTALTTTFASATQVKAAVPAALVASPGTASVTVTTSGGTSAGATFTINAPPPPTITSLTPSSVMAGGAAFTLLINGTNFVGGSAAKWNTTALTTSLVNATQVKATVPAALIASPGTANITVTTSGGASAGAAFTINAPPPPTITSLSPGSILAGSAGFTLVVNGTNFFGGSAVKWNGAALTTTFVSATQLKAFIAATLIAAPCTPGVAVTTPSGTSAGTAFTINAPPPPAITSLSPASATAGGAALTIVINGTNFFSGAAAKWNANALTTTFVNGTQVKASVPASLIASPGTASLTVTTASGASTGTAFTVNAPPPPTVTSLSPSSATTGGAAFTIVITGTNFFSGAAAMWNGSALTTTFVSATQVKAAVPAALLSGPGTVSVTVNTASGTSAGAAFTINPPPPPSITSLSPSSVTSGGAAFTLIVYGTKFVSGAVVNWNGGALTTTLVSATQVKAAVPASLIATAGTASVTVTTSGGTSGAAAFTIK